MMAGKTTRLLKSYRLAKRYKLGVSIIKPITDTRGGVNVITTHNGKLHKSDVFVLGRDNFPAKNRTRMVLVDEAQFFSVEEVHHIIQKSAKNDASFCTFFGLYEDYASQPFPASEYLMKVSHLQEHLTAKCAVCGAEATKTQRLVGGFPAPFGNKIEIGGTNKYESRCTSCYVHPSEVEELF